MRPICHPNGHVFDNLISAKSNDITNMFAKSILAPKIVYTSIYDYNVPCQFEIQNKELSPL